MKRLMPHPVLAVALLLLWLLLWESASLGTLILGCILTLGASLMLKPLDPPKTSLRLPLAAIRLVLVVFAEVVRSNNAVAWIILRGDRQSRTSGFVRIPLDTRHPYSLAALACIITATPGTIWVENDLIDNIMMLHVLDLIDEQEWVSIVKERYERPLMEIFE